MPFAPLEALLQKKSKFAPGPKPHDIASKDHGTGTKVAAASPRQICLQPFEPL